MLKRATDFILWDKQRDIVFVHGHKYANHVCNTHLICTTH